MSTANSAHLAGARVYVAGHRGLAGSAIVQRLEQEGCAAVIVRTHAELDLTDQAAVSRFFSAERPEYVFLAAAKVGGILANNAYPAEFISQNLAIQTNIIQAAYDSGVKRLLFLGSSCIYPRDCPQPIREEYMLTGPLEPTNRPYAVAKIAGIEMCWAFNRQYKTQYIAAMPTNLYGPNDNYNLANSHVLPALLRKMHEAKVNRASEVVVWGTGSPRREFLHSEDMADACLFLMKLLDEQFNAVAHSEAHPPLLNIGCGEDLTITELAETIRDVVGYKGKLSYDRSKPDGTPRKLLDVTRMKDLGWKARIPLRSGLESAYREFLFARADPGVVPPGYPKMTSDEV
jgi:GDP-L-fucose synthase